MTLTQAIIHLEAIQAGGSVSPITTEAITILTSYARETRDLFPDMVT